jgi:Holliday junction resolvase RusA-like endonuclease
MVSFIVRGAPSAKSRPRFRSVNGNVRAYTPKKSASYENLVKLEAQKHITTPINGPVGLYIHFYLPRPKRLIWKTRKMPAIYTDKRPDIDNLAKSVIDGLNNIAFRDDGQIAMLHIQKKYCEGDSQSRTSIKIERLENKINI